MQITSKDKELIAKAKSLVNPTTVPGGVIREVGCVLVTKEGSEFVGVSLHLSSGIGFCAEHSAVAAMVSQSNETQIDTIVAYGADKVLPPCGRCRELIHQIHANNLEHCWVIISSKEKVRLKELLPYEYNN